MSIKKSLKFDEFVKRIRNLARLFNVQKKLQLVEREVWSVEVNEKNFSFKKFFPEDMSKSCKSEATSLSDEWNRRPIKGRNFWNFS